MSIIKKPPAIYDSPASRRREHDERMMMENRIPEARDIDRIAAGATKREVPKISPRYRGAASTADTGNTGTITTNQGTVVLNHGDWWAYLGDPVGIFRKAYCYRWDAVSGTHVELPIEQNAGMYMVALPDIVNGAPMSIASVAYIGTALISLLFARQITFTDFIQSEATDPETGEHLISMNGRGVLKAINAIFRNGFFSGHIEADSGYIRNMDIDNVTIGSEALFLGSIISGPLVLVNEAPVSAQIDYGAGTSAYNLVRTERVRLELPSYQFDIGIQRLSITGTYEGQNIIQICYRYAYQGYNEYYYEVLVTRENGQETIVAKSIFNWRGAGNSAVNLTSALSFRYTSGGKTFKLFDLPTQNPLVPGAIWRSGNQLMIS